MHLRKFSSVYKLFGRGFCSQVMDKKPIVIGISGVTNGGKTTLSARLKAAFPKSHIIHQDKFFHDPNSGKIRIVPELNHGNYDELSALDMESMMIDVNEWINNHGRPVNGVMPPPLLFIEGFLLYNYRPLEQLFTKKYFLTLDKQECWNRRSKRHYDPPDPPGYCDIVVWPMYLQNKKEIEDQKDIVYLCGTRPPLDLFSAVYNDVHDILENHGKKYSNGEKVD